jgi:hypothetical protein
MYSRTELNVLQSALRSWRGPYKKGVELTIGEYDAQQKQLEIADYLARRFEEILYFYFELENK